MTRPTLSLCLVLAVCAGLLVTVAVPAHAIQYMTMGEASGGGAETPKKKTAVDKLKKKWEEQPEVVKEKVQEQVDKATDIATEKATDVAKKAGKKAWEKLKKSKTLGKYAKKAGKVLKRYKRVLGPAGKVWDAAEKGYETGGQIHQLIVDPLMTAHFDRKHKAMQRKLQEDIAQIRRDALRRNSLTPASPAPDPDTLEHYADQQRRNYLSPLLPRDDSHPGYIEAVEEYNKTLRAAQEAPAEAPQEPSGLDTPDASAVERARWLERRQAEIEQSRLTGTTVPGECFYHCQDEDTSDDSAVERARWLERRQAEIEQARLTGATEAPDVQELRQREAERQRRLNAGWEARQERGEAGEAEAERERQRAYAEAEAEAERRAKAERKRGVRQAEQRKIDNYWSRKAEQERGIRESLIQLYDQREAGIRRGDASSGGGRGSAGGGGGEHQNIHGGQSKWQPGNCDGTTGTCQ